MTTYISETCSIFSFINVAFLNRNADDGGDVFLPTLRSWGTADEGIVGFYVAFVAKRILIVMRVAWLIGVSLHGQSPTQFEATGFTCIHKA